MTSSIKNLDTLKFDNNSNKLNVNNNLIEILNNFCYIENENNIIINHYFFKQYMKNKPNHIDSLNTLNHLVDQIEKVLINYSSFNVHLNIKTLTLMEIDKNKDLIAMMSIMLKQKFPDKLNNCLIYEAPFIFSTFFSLISAFIDKDTQKKIKLMKN